MAFRDRWVRLSALALMAVAPLAALAEGEYLDLGAGLEYRF
jgi:hypothetical protein